MSLRLYDTATRSVRDFVPLLPGEASVYLCGLTVQSPPHIGHLRSAVNYDVLRRWLLATRDAHGVYAALGFAPLAQPERWMEINQNTIHAST